MKLLPYFRKMEDDLDFRGDDFHGSEGPIPVRRYSQDELLPVPSAFLEATQAAGFPFTHDMNHPESTGVGYYALNRIDGIRMSTALTYLQMARHRLNLTIRADVLVRRVLFDGDTAVGIEAESGGETFKIDAGEVVLCGGAINSPQLLMLSGVGPARAPGRDWGALGTSSAGRWTESARPSRGVYAIRECQPYPRRRTIFTDRHALYHARLPISQRYADAPTACSH